MIITMIMKMNAMNIMNTCNHSDHEICCKDVDMTVATTSNVPERAKDMDFSGVAFYVENLVILYKKPNPLDSTLSLLLKVCTEYYIHVNDFLLMGHS